MSAPTEPLFEVEDVSVRFPVHRGLIGALSGKPRRSVSAVDGVSFSVAAGEMVAVVGESGSGKSTTVHAGLRLIDGIEGRIRFEGREISGVPQRGLAGFRRRAQLIYQDPYESLDPRFRVGRTVEEPLVVHGIGTPGEDRRGRVVRALERAGLSPAELFIDRYPHELSGGQRQRVAIAAALILEPALIVADEPVSMLDVSVRAEILQLLDDLRRSGLGVVMITHDLSTAAHFADRILVMYLGRIVEQGAARDVIERPQHPYTRALLSVVPEVDPRRRKSLPLLHGEIPSPTDVPSGCRFHPRCPVAIERCRVDDPRVLEPTGEAGHGAACWLAGHRDAEPTGGSR